MVMKRAALRRVHLVILGVAMVTACDSAPLLAPVASTISVFPSATSVAPGGAVEITAVVVEEAGTAVHDGTLVRFTATLGIVEPAEVETREGVATTTFFAGGAAGTARVTATSGGAQSGPDQPNAIDITIGG
jgi:hypothetical protein